MKKIVYRIFVTALVPVLACSCLQNLNTVPLDTTTTPANDAYANPNSYLAGLAYINAYYNFVSAGDPVLPTWTSPMPDRVNSSASGPT